MTLTPTNPNLQSGATLVEYALVLALLVSVFSAAMFALMIGSAQRTKESIGVTQSVSPCGKDATSSRLKALVSSGEPIADKHEAACY